VLDSAIEQTDLVGPGRVRTMWRRAGGRGEQRVAVSSGGATVFVDRGEANHRPGPTTAGRGHDEYQTMSSAPSPPRGEVGGTGV